MPGGFRLPARDSRTTIVGGTGSGKTYFAAWLLSRVDFDRRPWLAIDSKRDPVFGRLLADRAAQRIRLGHRFARRDDGLYLAQPNLDDDEALEKLFRHFWERGRMGLWIDELYSMPDGAPLDSLYYQGRSRGVQIIGSVQRPSRVTLFAFSEASHIAVFSRPNLARDMQRIEEFAPGSADVLDRGLNPYTCLWYDCAQHKQYVLTPAPPIADTSAAVAARQPYRYWG